MKPTPWRKPPAQRGLAARSPDGRIRWVTAHALTRFLQRWYAGYIEEHARRELTREVEHAEYIERDGDDLIYRTPRGALLVVAGDGAVRTVLPQGAVRTTYRPKKG